MNLRMQEVLLYFYLKYNKDWNNVYKAIERKERVDATRAAEIFSTTEKYFKVVTVLDSDYPEEYKKDYYKPPFVLLSLKEDVDIVQAIQELNKEIADLKYDIKMLYFSEDTFLPETREAAEELEQYICCYNTLINSLEEENNYEAQC